MRGRLPTAPAGARNRVNPAFLTRPELLAHRLDQLPPARDRLQRLGGLLADLRQRIRAAASAGCRRRHHHEKRFAPRPEAGEPVDFRGLRRGPLGRQLALRRARLELVELEFKLIEKPQLAFRAPTVEFVSELLDFRLQEGDLGFRVGHLRRRVRSPRLGLGSRSPRTVRRARR